MSYIGGEAVTSVICNYVHGAKKVVEFHAEYFKL